MLLTDTKPGYNVAKQTETSETDTKTAESCQSREKTLFTDTKPGRSVADEWPKITVTDTDKEGNVSEMSRNSIRIVAIGTVPGPRQQLTPIFASRTSTKHHPAAIYPHFCCRNICRTTFGSNFIPFLLPEPYVNKKRFFGR